MIVEFQIISNLQSIRLKTTMLSIPLRTNGLLFTWLFAWAVGLGQAQSKLSHQVYLLANTADLKKNDPFWSILSQKLAERTVPTTLLFLGDLIKDLEGTPEDMLDQVELLKQLVHYGEEKNVKAYFLSGDRDWDQSGKNGEKEVRFLEDYIEKTLQAKKTFYPSNGCPGPKSIELNKYTVLIAINSQWFIHPHNRPEFPRTDCSVLTEEEFWEELEDEIEDAEGKNVIIAAHHPIFSSGQFAGKKLNHFHLLPLFGTLYTSFRQQIGRPEDMTNPAYQNYIYRIKSILSNHASLVYVSGHEFHLEALKAGDNFFLNSGALGHTRPVGKNEHTLYKTSKNGFFRINYYDEGEVDLESITWQGQKMEHRTIPLMKSPCSATQFENSINTAFNPCKNNFYQFGDSALYEGNKLGIAIAGEEYTAGKLKTSLMGAHYRKDWTTSIRAPYLDMRNNYQGLKPFAKGGGLQTLSLKFKAGDGKEYAFRSVNKDPVKGLDDLAKQTVYRHIAKDLITTQHPYGGLVASKLLDATDILHARPKLYIMPNDPLLGFCQEDFANKLGTVEIRPKGPKKGIRGFANADYVYSSNKLFHALFEDNDNRIDAKAYARARAFDLLVGDWDRHEDNWKWAGYKQGKQVYFKPIPRDRDHVFSQWEGLIPSIADLVIPNAESFEKDFKNINHLSFKARHLDRQLGNSLTLKDWLEASDYLQRVLTDTVIGEAINELPEEVRHISGPEIKEKLIARRAQLSQAVTKLYKNLAKEVDVIGSNKREIFKVERLVDGRLKVQVYDRNKETGQAGKMLYQRVFQAGETKEVRLFGLGNDDAFYIKGKSDRSILVRIIGGKGIDEIIDYSNVKKGKSLTKVYDSTGEDKIQKGTETVHLSPSMEARYDNKAFEYNYFSPFPKFRISSGNGFGLELLLTYNKLGFNKPDYAQRYQAKLIYYPALKAHRIDLKNWHRHIIGKFDLYFQLRFSTLYDKFPFFYGIGNNTTFDEELLEDDYYRIDYNTTQFTTALERTFWNKSKFRFGLKYEFNNIDQLEDDNTVFEEPQHRDLNGLGKQHLLGWITELDFDFRDNPLFSYNGSQLFFTNQVFKNFSDDGKFFGKVEGYFAHYLTVKPFTVALRSGFSQSYGEVPFNQLSALGSNAYLRAHFRNRFLGDRTLYFNSELRLNFGAIRTALFPIKWGVFAFWDTGRVWHNNDQKNNSWHDGWGGGFYLAPLNENLNVIFYYGRSVDRNRYFSVSTGFDLQ